MARRGGTWHALYECVAKNPAVDLPLQRDCAIAPEKTGKLGRKLGYQRRGRIRIGLLIGNHERFDARLAVLNRHWDASTECSPRGGQKLRHLRPDVPFYANQVYASPHDPQRFPVRICCHTDERDPETAGQPEREMGAWLQFVELVSRERLSPTFWTSCATPDSLESV